MISDTGAFAPIPTGEIPLPILEEVPAEEGAGAKIPRVLLQSVGSGKATQRVLGLVMLFVLFALLLLILLVRLPRPEALVVYGDFPRKTLMEDHR